MSKSKTGPAEIRRGTSQFRLTWNRLRKNPRAIVCMIYLALFFLVVIFADQLADYNTSVVYQNLKERFMAPCAAHPFGTDAMGRDIMGRLLHGTRVAALLGFVPMLLSAFIGTMVGCAAAYFGGRWDNLLMRVIDVISTIPSLILAMAICAGFGNGMWQLILALTVGQIPNFSRGIRAKALSVVNEEFIEAGKAQGASDLWLIVKYIVPNVLSILLVQATLTTALNILTGATLSFIGLGVKAPTPEWGSMLKDSISTVSKAPYQIVFPGIALVLTSLAINTFGDCLRDAFDPHLKGKA